jgi:Cytochrome b(N-terminal)/b6/petB
MAFTGYLLPWDEKAYFASAVGTNLIAEVPLIGPLLQKLVRGGDQMGTLTISRFYVLHVFILPGLLIAFIAAHVFFFRKAGAAGPIKEDPVRPKLPPVPFYPRQVVMDAIFAIILIGILAIISVTMGHGQTPRTLRFYHGPSGITGRRFSGSNTSAAAGLSLAESFCLLSSRSSLPRCRFWIDGSNAGHGEGQSRLAHSCSS